MSKAFLIMITGIFVIIGGVQLALQNRLFSSDFGVSEKAWRTAAYTNASSAIEAVAQKIVLNPGWANTGETYVGHFPEGLAEVSVTQSGSFITLNAVSEVESKQVQIEAIYRWTTDAFMPVAASSMGIYSNNLNFNISGSAFSISGYDYLTDGTINPDGTPVAGMSFNSQTSLDVVLAELNSNQQNNITGTGSSPSLELIDYNNSEFEQVVQLLVNQADYIYDFDFTAHGAGSLGTPESPKIIVVDGTLEVSNATGAGVLIIRENGQLDVRGNLDHYEGLIIVQGIARLVRGNIKVYGSMLFGGLDPELEIDIDLRGNVHIAYSSQALNNIEAKLSGRFDGHIMLLGIYQ